MGLLVACDPGAWSIQPESETGVARSTSMNNTEILYEIALKTRQANPQPSSLRSLGEPQKGSEGLRLSIS